MPGPRRKKPPKHNFPPLSLPVGVNEIYLMEWFEFGLSELGEYLAKRLAFAHYLEQRDHFNAMD